MAGSCREQTPRQSAADPSPGAAPRLRTSATDRPASEGYPLTQAELWEPHAASVRLEVAPTFPTPACTVVTEPAALTRLLPQLYAAPRLGVDTETTGLDPLTDRLRLLQLATTDQVIVVDLATVPLPMLVPLFAQEREWLVHNGLFDVRFVTAAGLQWSGHLFDTMLMSQLLGTGTPEGNLGQSGLGAVVQRYLGLQLPKALQHSRWDGPLTPMQLECAVRDAAVLLPLADRLTQALRVSGLKRAAHIENACVPALA